MTQQGEVPEGFATVVVEGLREEIEIPNNLGAAAFAAGRYEEAEAHYARAIAALHPADDALAVALYENLGFARFNLGWYREAARALLRALDGAPTSRPEALRFVILALISDGKRAWARRLLVTYEQAFGPHPEGVQSEMM
jgi:tetratricopeptide (TPR) repeat protein